jgi:hypothetical protein
MLQTVPLFTAPSSYPLFRVDALSLLLYMCSRLTTVTSFAVCLLFVPHRTASAITYTLLMVPGLDYSYLTLYSSTSVTE